MSSTRGQTLWLTLLVGCAPLVSWADEPPKRISVVEAWAHMARRETEMPVSIQGQVTFCDSRLGLAYLQDESGGIGFDPRSEAAMPLVPGDMVQVEGFLTRREGLAMILRHRVDLGAPKVTVLPPTASRVQAIRFDLNDAAQMRID
ncbi:MAG: hypothetical protein U0984_15940, partial [Prosthecobacter sp.]|nr:hypothetical protein [Prosthecobacter sp.]